MAFLKNFKIYFLLFLSPLLVSCEKKFDLSTPATTQIKEYTDKFLSSCLKKTENGVQKKETGKKPIYSDNPYPLSLRDMDVVLGNRGSKIIVIAYFSPTCPHCAYYEKEIFPKLKEKFIDSGKIAYAIREFITNKQDLDASLLARCRGDEESFLNFTKATLESQDSWAFGRDYREKLIRMASWGGIGEEEYNACLGDNEKIKFLIENTKEAHALRDFPGTPSFFIDGVLYKGAYSVEALSKSIGEALDKNGE